jgi:hypothetical protein
MLNDMLRGQRLHGFRLFPDAIKVQFESFMGNATATMEVISNILTAAGLSTAESDMKDIREMVVAEMTPGAGSREKFKYDLEAFGAEEAQLANTFDEGITAFP